MVRQPLRSWRSVEDKEAVGSRASARKELSCSGNQDEIELKLAGKSRRLELVGKSVQESKVESCWGSP